jgi:hypothetical protein
MRIAVDRDVLKCFLQADPGDAARQTVARLFERVSAVCVLPLIVQEIEAEGNKDERGWRASGFEEIKPTEFLMGCATGMASRYLDYYPDPRDCRLVAEAECAKLDAVVTLNPELVRGLGGRTENIAIATPEEALRSVGKRRDR